MTESTQLKDLCPGCLGPITFSPGDDYDPPVTVFFHCANVECKWGKP